MKELNPARDNIKVRAIRTSGKVLIVETNNNENARKIAANKKLGEVLKCEPPKRKRPLMILYDVPVEYTEEETKRCMYQQYFAKAMTEEQIRAKVNRAVLYRPEK